MSYCPECGENITGKENFCPECGFKINNEGTSGGERKDVDKNDSHSIKTPSKSNGDEVNRVDNNQIGSGIEMVLIRGVFSLLAVGIITAGVSAIVRNVLAGLVFGVVAVLAGNFYYHYQIGKASTST
jgi:hypothetical protein